MMLVSVCWRVNRSAELEEAPKDDHYRVLALFPNSFPVTGLKHIADNLLGSILQSLPQCLDNDCASFLNQNHGNQIVRLIGFV